MLILASIGCSRTKYRLQADHEAYCAIAERNGDPRWQATDPRIDIDPRSRYFDPHSIDCPPMPTDDPTSHQYMRSVDGKKGWKHWDANGQRMDLENPSWFNALPEYADLSEQGAVKLDVDTALRLAYVHSPTHQNQLETLYLTALDVTAERFRLDTQYFGGYDVAYNHNGSLVPAGLTFDDTAGNFVVSTPFDADSVETNRLTLGGTNAGNPTLQASRRFATAGQLLVGFANSFVVEFTGANANLSASLLNFSFIQPLLRGAGRDVALEQLTFAERKLLANLRGYSQFRQGFYTQVAIGELGVRQLNRGRDGTSLQSFSGQGGVNGYFGLLQQLQQIRYSEDNLKLQLRTLARLEAFLDADQIDRVQVEQFRQNIQIDRDSLLRAKANLELSLDRYKTDTLGLPPDLPIELDDSPIAQFQLVTSDASQLQDSIVALQVTIGQLPSSPQAAEFDQILAAADRLTESTRRQFTEIDADFEKMDDAVRGREQRMSPEQVELFQKERQQLSKELDNRKSDFDKAVNSLLVARRLLAQNRLPQARNAMITWTTEVLRLVERTILVRARARLEVIEVPSVNLRSDEAFDIALMNRLDFMNGRASLVDTWRLIQFNADALQGVLNITADGTMRTAGDSPVDFRAPTSNVRLGVEFDAPLTRLLERNAYRESLINYQRSRRDFIQSRDSLSLGLRALLRQLEQLRRSLEIQRQAVATAVLRADLTQANLTEPSRPTPTGQANRLNPTTAINLLSAQASLRSSQNSLLSVWLNYYAARLRLYRELGVMSLDPEGEWVEYPLPGSEFGGQNEFTDLEIPLEEIPPLPPTVPSEFLELLQRMPAVAAEPVLPATNLPPVNDPMAMRNTLPFPGFIQRLSELPGDLPPDSIRQVQHLVPIRD